MISRGSVDGDAPLRLFLALRLRDDDLDHLVAWSHSALRGCEPAEGCRLVGRDQLHVTVAFLGNRSPRELDRIVDALRGAASEAGPVALRPVRWRTTRSVGMLELHDDGGHAAALVRRLQAGLAAVGAHRPEPRPWLPHVTICRFRGPLCLEVSGLPERTCVPSDAAAYVSHLHPTGARYEVLRTVDIPRGEEPDRAKPQGTDGREPRKRIGGKEQA